MFIGEDERAVLDQATEFYGKDKRIVFDDESEEGRLVMSGSFGNAPIVLHRDPDVLDTWFSSALWPFEIGRAHV